MRNFQLLVAACGLVLSASGLQGQAAQDLVHKEAPEFARKALSGQRIDLKDYRGRVVLLNFWATWCVPCQAELPKFEAWQKQYGTERLQVIGVSMDDGEAPVRRTVRRLHLDFPVVMGNARLGNAYGRVLGLPVTFLIDRDGRVVAKIKGEIDMDSFESQVKELLER